MPDFLPPQSLLSAAVILFLITAVLAAVLLSRLASLRRTLRAQREENRQTFSRLSEENRALWERLMAMPDRNELQARSEALLHTERDERQRQSELYQRRLDDLGARFDTFSLGQEQRLRHIAGTLDEKLGGNEQRLDTIRERLTQSLASLQQENAKKLEEMRQTVDEKLHATLDRRLSESFSLVSRRLEEVSRGLGEMRTLAHGVGDLKKVLSNVKTRGIWGEAQLGSILEQLLSPQQYRANVPIPEDSEQRVEFAVLLPGSGDETVLLPIDAKFPMEDYQRLCGALESGTLEDAKAARAALETALKTEVKRISGKYILPPRTTDFAVMFLPLEGLYAEALRAPGLAEEAQSRYHVLIAGPVTLSALLTSLRVGFRTLAIEKRSGEVWQLLSAVKTEFGRFSLALDSAKKRIHSVEDSLDIAAKRSQTIERKLQNVENGLPAGLLPDAPTSDLPSDASD